MKNLYKHSAAIYLMYTIIFKITISFILYQMNVSGIELVGPSKRVFAGIVIEFFWCVGLYILDIAAFFVRDWNILQLVIVAFAPLMIAYYWYVNGKHSLSHRGSYIGAHVLLNLFNELGNVISFSQRI